MSLDVGTTAGLVASALSGARVDAASMARRHAQNVVSGHAVGRTLAVVGANESVSAAGRGVANVAAEARDNALAPSRYDTRDRVDISAAALVQNAQAAQGRAAGRGGTSIAPESLADGSLSNRARETARERLDGAYGLEPKVFLEQVALRDLRAAFPGLADEAPSDAVADAPAGPGSGLARPATGVDSAGARVRTEEASRTRVQTQDEARLQAAPTAGKPGSPDPERQRPPAADQAMVDTVRAHFEERSTESDGEERARAHGPAPEATPSQNRETAAQATPASSHPAARGEPSGHEPDRQAVDREASDPERPRDGGGEPLDDAELRQVEQLKQTDRAVRQHENAHVAAGGSHVTHGARYDYQQGPDGKRYAVGGEVGIDTSEESSPEATIRKMQTVRAAALAPADPSSQDRAVAAAAAQREQAARMELARGEDGSGAPRARTASSGRLTEAGMSSDEGFASANAALQTRATAIREDGPSAASGSGVPASLAQARRPAAALAG